MKGAPIRFVVAVLGGWTCVRLAVLLPDAAPLVLAGDVLAPRAEARGKPARTEAAGPVERFRIDSAVSLRRIHHAGPPRIAVPGSVATGADTQVAAPVPQSRTIEAAQAVLVPMIVGTSSSTTAPRRWSVSAWLVARGGASGTLSGGRLGASQAGARLLYRVDSGRRLALAGRIAAPLEGRGAEAAIGVDWQPTTAPIHLVAEQRFGLDGARGGPTAMVIGGLNPKPIAAGFRLEAYAQAGAILRDGRAEAFGDGAARLIRPIATIDRATVDFGVGTWAAGQRGAARVDIGPTIGVALPVAGRGVRLSLDWRERVAGRARPGSGPALSIGSDF